MKYTLLSLFNLCLLLLYTTRITANWIPANPSNYTSFLNTLKADDTLFLASGTYIHNLTLNGRNGTSTKPIVILGNGNSTVFQGQSCCNTVSITKCSYLIIKNLQLDGLQQNVDAVKAEGTVGNWAHHITLEYLHIMHYGFNQQNVGISTKCSAWDWVIRKNKIIGAGTGLYLGNSTGEAPFVNGIIEYNYVANSIGYNMEIKHQLDTVRDNFAGTSVNGKTIIRHNVFTKDVTSSTGGNARPNVLVGGFPLHGWGAADYYEIYGNFFYNNPVEALFQGTGNIMLYKNIFVNHFNPSGFRAIYITPHNGVSPQDIRVYHNTIWALNSSGGIRLYNPNPGYTQYCYSNAVFAATPITNFVNVQDNITDTYSNAGNYVLSASSQISTLNLYPKAGQLTGTVTTNSLFTNNTFFNKDFNGHEFDWIYRGAYSGCCTNKGWPLQLDTMPEIKPMITDLLPVLNHSYIDVYPNPISDRLNITLTNFTLSKIKLCNLQGKVLFSGVMNSSPFSIDCAKWPVNVYILVINTDQHTFVKRILKSN